MISRPTDLPRNPNGKIDRKALAEQLRHLFQVNEG
jgi:acyl-CoA synthetase (AMP-forming)/AMP-acid ligase II